MPKRRPGDEEAAPSLVTSNRLRICGPRELPLGPKDMGSVMKAVQAKIQAIGLARRRPVS